MSAVIQFVKNYRRDIQYLSHGDDLAALATYAGQLHAYTTAAITRIAVTTAQVLALPETTNEYDSITLQAKLILRDTDTGERWGIMINAPLSTMFEEVTGQGYRVKQTIGEELAGYYATFSGLPLEFVEGWLVGGR